MRRKRAPTWSRFIVASALFALGSPGIDARAAEVHGEKAAERGASAVTAVGLVVVASSPGAKTDGWLAAELAYANDRFADVGLHFVVRDGTGVAPLSAAEATIGDAATRDQIGRKRHALGTILVIAPLRLVDLDGVTTRSGVHWRDRQDRRGEDQRRRWIIVARNASEMVLAHELGHFFGLPHSTAPTSFMNKTIRQRPARSAWRLTRHERRVVQRRLAAMLKAKTLVAGARAARP